MEEVAKVVGVHYHTVQRWVGWYRQGGIAKVCAGHGGGHGQPTWLTPEQEAAVAEEAAKGKFTTAADVRRWVADQFGVTYRPKEATGCCAGCIADPKCLAPFMSKRTWRPRKTGIKGLCRSLAGSWSNLWETPGLGR